MDRSRRATRLKTRSQTDAVETDPVGSPTPPPRPQIFDTAIWIGVIALIAFSVVGIALAVCGWFRPPAVLIGTLVLGTAAFFWVRPAIAHHEVGPRPHWLLTGAVVILAAGAGMFNGAYHGEHLLTERDPGVYAATGLWLADNGTLRIEPPQGPFRDAPGVRQSQIGFSHNDSGSLDAQFPHLNAVFLAGGSWIGLTKLFMVPALLMAAALLLVYALGVRLGTPYGGAFGALALAVSFPYVYVARDTYSEPLALLLLLGGLWALTFVRRGGIRPGIIAGALLGATALARIDGYIPLIPIAGILALEYLLARRMGDRRRAAGFWATYVAMAIVAGAGAVEVWVFSRSYYDSNLAGRITTMVAGIIVGTIAGLLGGRYLYRLRSGTVTPRPALRWGYGVLTVGIVALLVWARYIRPDFVGLRAAIDRDLGTIHLLPWAKTLSYLWLEWYLGPLLVAGGFAALIWMTGHGLSSRNRTWLPTASVGFATTLLYLVSPSITPDQPWAIRRFVAVSIPILVLAAGMALEAIGRRRPPWTVLGAAALAVAALVFPVQVTNRFVDTSIGDSLATRFDEICRVAHEEPSAILVTPAQSLGYTMPESLRSWCGVPAAGAEPGITEADIEELSAAWRAEGKRLLLVTTSREGLKGVSGPVTGVPGPVLMRPEGSVDHAPRKMEPDSRVAQSPDGVLPLFVIEVR